jgi:hypothetical protein
LIYFNIPWAEDKDIANAYNQFMEIVPSDNDFACFIDGDAMFADEFFGSMLYKVVGEHPDKNFFCSYVSRCAYDGSGVWAIPTDEECESIKVPRNIITESNDMAIHRSVGKLLWEKNRTSLTKVNQDFLDARKTSSGDPSYFSGTCFLIRKSLWKKIKKFKPFWRSGSDLATRFFGVDNRLHKDVLESGESLYLMRGVYSYHWYRNVQTKQEFYDYNEKIDEQKVKSWSDA